MQEVLDLRGRIDSHRRCELQLRSVLLGQVRACSVSIGNVDIKSQYSSLVKWSGNSTLRAMTHRRYCCNCHERATCVQKARLEIFDRMQNRVAQLATLEDVVDHYDQFFALGLL